MKAMEGFSISAPANHEGDLDSPCLLALAQPSPTQHWEYGSKHDRSSLKNKQLTQMYHDMM